MTPQDQSLPAKIKVCSKCKDPKDEDAFGLRNRVRNVWCKSCCAKAVRDCYAKNLSYRESSKDRKIRVALENIVYVFQYLQAHPCADCGEPDPLVLEFDHINPKEKEENITAMMQRSRESIDKEIARCVIRCANCHRRKTAREQNSTRYQLSQHPDISKFDLVRLPIEKIDRAITKTPRAKTENHPEIPCTFCGTMFASTYKKLQKFKDGKDVFCNAKCSNRSKVKSGRKDLILSAVQAYPVKSYTQIGTELGLTATYIGIVARGAGITRNRVAGRSIVCNNRLFGDVA